MSDVTAGDAKPAERDAGPPMTAAPGRSTLTVPEAGSAAAFMPERRGCRAQSRAEPQTIVGHRADQGRAVQGPRLPPGHRKSVLQVSSEHGGPHPRPIGVVHVHISKGRATSWPDRVGWASIGDASGWWPRRLSADSGVCRRRQVALIGRLRPPAGGESRLCATPKASARTCERAVPPRSPDLAGRERWDGVGRGTARLGCGDPGGPAAAPSEGGLVVDSVTR